MLINTCGYNDKEIPNLDLVSLRIRGVSIVQFKKTLSLIAIFISTLPYPSIAADAAGMIALQRSILSKSNAYQAAYILSALSIDSDSDGYFESPEMATGTTPPTGGGFVPTSTGAPLSDGYGYALGYCAWDNGATTISTNRIAGSVGMAKLSIAILSPGINGVFDTTCANLYSSAGPSNDDYVATLTSAQISMGGGVSIDIGKSVNTVADLPGIDPSSLVDGQIRITKDTNQIYRWNAGTTTWDSVTSWIRTGNNLHYATGNVGVGGPADATAKFYVQGGVARFDGGINIGTDPFVDAGRNVSATTINGLTLGLGGGSLDSNVAISVGALANNTTGVYNIAHGRNALIANKTGNHNTAIGNWSLRNNISGSYNVALGFQSLDKSDAFNNVGVGYQSLMSNTSGHSNTAIGMRPLNSNTTGSHNIALGGNDVMFKNLSGNHNWASGYNALYNNITGSNNIALGTSALYTNTSGASNFAAGYQSNYSNTAGSDNISIGDGTLWSNISSWNIALGRNALQFNTTGGENVGIGLDALKPFKTGWTNTSLGSGSGSVNATSLVTQGGAGNHNTFIGAYSGIGPSIAATLNYATVLGAGAAVTTSNTIVLGRAGVDYVVIGATGRDASTDVLQVTGNIGATGSVNTINGYQVGGVTVIDSLRNATFNNLTVAKVNGLTLGLGGGSLDSNVAISVGALASNTTGARNIANGNQALYRNNIGYDNIANGSQALYSNTTGFMNIASGNSALYNNTEGYGNIASGRWSLSQNTTGANNIALGYASLYSNKTGNNNVGIGNESLYSMSTFSHNNTGVGTFAGAVNSLNLFGAGSNNTFVGYMSGVGIAAEAINHSTVLGANATVTTSNTVVLGQAGVDYVVIGATGRDASTDVLQVTGAAKIIGNMTASSFIPSSSTIPTNGLYLPAANKIGIASNSIQIASFDSTAITFTRPIIVSATTDGTNPIVSGNNCTTSGGLGRDAAGDLYICK